MRARVRARVRVRVRGLAATIAAMEMASSIDACAERSRASTSMPAHGGLGWG